jgi:hypothetical protein
MSGFVKAGQTFLKTLMSGGKKSGDGKAIKSFKPGTKFEGIPKYQKEIIKARSNVQKSFKPINEGIANQTKQLRQTLQGMRGERITQSGISKGKDVTPGIYEPKKKIEKKGVVDKTVTSKKVKKAISDIKGKNFNKGGRVGFKRGTGLMPKKKSNVDKIKKTFGPKNKLGMQSVIYGLDKNPKITKADPKAKFIAAANKKNKKVI